MKQTHPLRRALALLLAFSLTLANFLSLSVMAEDGDTGAVLTTTVNLSE